MKEKEMYIIEADKMQGYIVTKDNQLIRRSLYDLSLMEQRILACAISTVDSREELRENELPQCEIGVKAFCELCGIERRGAITYLMNVLIKLRDRSFWVQKDDGTYSTFSWVSEAEINEKNDTIVVLLSKSLKPYILDLNSRFTSYKLPMILRFTNKYSNMIFDLIYAQFKENGYPYGAERRYPSGVYEISVEEMKQRVRTRKGNNNEMTHQNINFADIKNHMINPAVEDINRFTDIMVSVEYIKNGRKVETILFNYRAKNKSELAKVPLFRGKKIESI